MLWITGASSGIGASRENRDRNVKINLTAPGSANTEVYPGSLPPGACHPTVEWLLNLDEHSTPLEEVVGDEIRR